MSYETWIPCSVCDGRLRVRYTVYEGQPATRRSPAEPAEAEVREVTGRECRRAPGEYARHDLSDRDVERAGDRAQAELLRHAGREDLEREMTAAERRDDELRDEGRL